MAEFIKPSFEIILQDDKDAVGYQRHIEKIGRLCYKSGDKITEQSYEGFIDRMDSSKHFAMLEHGTIYLKFPIENGLILGHYLHNNYSKCIISNSIAYITTNYRVIVENKYQDDLQYQCEPTEYHERRYSVKFTMDRIGSQSVCRHRVFSFAQESTRFCNYSKNKFGSHVKISVPSWIKETDYSEERQAEMEKRIEEILRPKTFWEKVKSLFKKEKYLDKDATAGDWWLLANMMSEKAYMNLTETYKWTAQEARSVLPCDLNTEIVMTGFASDWIHFFNLRSLGLTGAPHPDIKVIADELKDEFIKRGFILENQLGKE